MGERNVLHLGRARQARECRGFVEDGLDEIAWKWSPRISAWLDLLLVIVEDSGQ